MNRRQPEPIAFSGYKDILSIMRNLVAIIMSTIKKKTATFKLIMSRLPNLVFRL